MATYDEKYFKDAAYYHPTGGGPLAGRTTSRAYLLGDIVRLHKVERDTKLGDVCVAADVAMGAAAAGVFEITNGTSPVVLVTLAIAVLNGATGDLRIRRLDNPAALGWVVPAQGYYLQFRFTGAAVTPGQLAFSVERTNVTTGSESPIAPTG